MAAASRLTPSASPSALPITNAASHASSRQPASVSASVRVVAPGHRMPAWVAAGWNDYARRMPRTFPLVLVEVKAEPRGQGKTRMPKELTAVVTDDGDERSAHDALSDVPSNESSPEAMYLAHEAVAVAQARLDEMGDKYGNVFMMRFRDGYSESEIARKLKLNVGTVKTRAYRARTAVRDELEHALAA